MYATQAVNYLKNDSDFIECKKINKNKKLTLKFEFKFCNGNNCAKPKFALKNKVYFN